MATQAKTVLVTGGCGFMGSHFIRLLHTKYPEYRIVNLDSVTYAGNGDNLNDLERAESENTVSDRRYDHVVGDICDVPLVMNLFKTHNFDFVVHFAAETHVDRSIFNFGDFIRTNVEGTRVLLEAARVHKTPRFVHISTDEVYGNVLEGFSDEGAPLNPSSPYAASKTAGDMLARTYAKVYELPVVIVRSSNNYASFQYPEKLIPLTITNLIEGAILPIHGEGTQIRSWLHVNDFCRAVDLMAHDTQQFSIYNLAGEARTNLQIIEHIAKILGKDHTPHLNFVPDRPCADLRYAPDCSRIERELGWKREHSLDEVLPSVVAWYLENDAWWRKIKTKKEFLDHYEKQSKASWY